ncbi:MAG TPA: hypothetical protein VH477_09155 [Bryobacteraceae bacterium]
MDDGVSNINPQLRHTSTVQGPLRTFMENNWNNCAKISGMLRAIQLLALASIVVPPALPQDHGITICGTTLRYGMSKTAVLDSLSKSCKVTIDQQSSAGAKWWIIESPVAAWVWFNASGVSRIQKNLNITDNNVEMNDALLTLIKAMAAVSGKPVPVTVPPGPDGMTLNFPESEVVVDAVVSIRHSQYEHDIQTLGIVIGHHSFEIEVSRSLKNPTEPPQVFITETLLK